MVSVNKEAMKLIREVIANQERLGIEVHTLKNGVKVIDMGVNVPGSWEAGIYFTRITMGNLGRISLAPYQLPEQNAAENLDLTGVSVYSDQVVIATLASQIAGWQFKSEEFAIIGTGPARAVAVLESDWYFKMTDYRDKADECILCLQMTTLPDEKIGEIVALKCGIKPEDTYLLVAPSASIVGSIQVAARSVEQTVHKLFEHDFNLEYIRFARGFAPVAPVINDELEAMGRINDALLYGAISEFWVECDDEEIEKVVDKVLTSYSSECGKPFGQLYLEADKDFFKMDHDIHGVAKIQIHNLRTGNVFKAGRLYPEVLLKSFSGRVLSGS